MPDVTLKKPNRLMTCGFIFQKGETKDVPLPVFRKLYNRWRHNFDFPAEGVTEMVTTPLTEDEQAEKEMEGSGGARPEKKADRIEAIREALEALDPDNEAHFTRAGLPDARALSSILGWAVTAAERDEAFAKGEPVNAASTDPATGKVTIVRRGKGALAGESGASDADGADGLLRTGEPVVEV